MAKIGKGALENMTHALYKDSRVVFREYIQNSSDQIDIARKESSFPEEKLEIIININTKKRSISIKDNANGIPRNEVKRRLEVVADSEKKQGENKGFRGIGRLGGISYCNELRFITTSKGENIETTMIWDAKRLQEIYSDESNHSSAEDILDEIISYTYREVDVDQHYFDVQMIDIKPEEEKLLDYKNIKQYISEVAPVDFKKTFIYKSKIDEFVNSNADVPPICHYIIGIRKDSGELNYIYKDFQTNIYKMQGKNKVVVDTVRDIHADVIYDSQGNPLAWIWFAVSSLKGAINEVGNPWKGLRLRQFNIQIGENNTLASFFKEPRGNSYFMGEVHTIEKRLRPNARRDYFNDNLTVRAFENAITSYFKELSKLYKAGSEINSGYEKIKKAEKLSDEYNEKRKTGFTSPEAQAQKKVELVKANELAEDGLKTINKYKNQAKDNEDSAIAQLVTVINNERKIDITKVEIKSVPEQLKKCSRTEGVEISGKSKSGAKGNGNGKSNANIDGKNPKPEKPKLLVDELSSYDKKTRKIIGRIYEMIEKNLPPDDADALVSKIHRELKKE